MARILEKEFIATNGFINNVVEKTGDLVQELMPPGPNEDNIEAFVSLLYADLVERYNINEEKDNLQ